MVSSVYSLCHVMENGVMVGLRIFRRGLSQIAAITVLTPFLMMFGAEELGGLGLSYQFMFIFMDVIFFTAVFVLLLLAPETKGRQLEEIVATEVYAEKKAEKVRSIPM